MQIYANNEVNLKIYELDLPRWVDFEKLFGERGACDGCWCMSWRLKRSDFERQKGKENRSAMRTLVEQNMKTGVLAYIDNEPIGWCAVAPREDYLRLENSRVLKRIDNEQVWSVTCFFISKSFRRKGISLELLKGVIKYCEINNVKIIEGYPGVPYGEQVPDAFEWTGIPSAFEKAGFVEVERRSKSKPIMRYCTVHAKNGTT
ncbi:GNAT family N-acetyltransferase [Desulfosporosinus metallidurans]|uniref:GCN5-related N-acetyltransferase n=1 Tax=Desulfosporosinus metallidurans TaxID=1888891 RepID=A0A1Q8QG96_9FIRM|nr:GNAT family N-acetyltransferase [Desulfosporosinus metallidurans]OLN26369.1 GCN5-related N-acetyltransferase [Desulfosporosinus metallidurans]